MIFRSSFFLQLDQWTKALKGVVVSIKVLYKLLVCSICGSQNEENSIKYRFQKHVLCSFAPPRHLSARKLCGQRARGLRGSTARHRRGHVGRHPGGHVARHLCGRLSRKLCGQWARHLRELSQTRKNAPKNGRLFSPRARV